jgi:hypothetical protein
MTIRNATWLFFGAILLAAPVVSAATFTIGAGNGSEADGTYINESATGANYGSGTRYWVGGASTGTDVYILLNWPALKDSLYGRTVDACSIFVKPTATVDNTDGLFACFQIRAGRDWVEAQATWTDYKTSNGWSTAGAKNTTSDIVSTAVDAKTESQFASGVYTPFDITSIARQWDGNDTANCRGVVVKQYGGTDPTQLDIGSDDNVTAANRPKIKVVYREGIDSPVNSRRRRSVISLIHDYDLKNFNTRQLKEKS